MSLCTDHTERCPLEAVVNFFTIFMTLAYFFLVFFFFSSTYRPLKKNPICAILGHLAVRVGPLDISFGAVTLFFVVLFLPNQLNLYCTDIFVCS